MIEQYAGIFVLCFYNDSTGFVAQITVLGISCLR